jgi:uncharacterized membrane protein
VSVSRAGGQRAAVPGPVSARGTNAVNALIHLYRAEVGRMTTYRRRLDTTTNWAVTSTALVASFAFDRPEHSHASFLFLMSVIYFFLHLEARRFRAYEASRHRVRLIERHFYAEMMGRQVPADWLETLGSALRYFYTPATDHWNAVGWRLRAGYSWIYGAVLAAWLVKMDIASSHLAGLAETARLGSIPGWVVVVGVVAFYAWLVFLTVSARGDDRFGDDEVETSPVGLVGTDTAEDSDRQ